MPRSEGFMYDVERKLDGPATAAKLNELADQCEAKVTAFTANLAGEGDTSKRFSFRHTMEWDLGVSIANDWLAKEYRSLAQAVENFAGRPSGQPQVEEPDPDDPERTRRVRYLSAEEHVDWSMARALDIVLRAASNPWSRSTGTSTNFVEDMEAGAAVEFLSTLGWKGADSSGLYFGNNPLVRADD